MPLTVLIERPMFSILVMAFALLGPAHAARTQSVGSTVQADPQCALTLEQKRANRSLAWSDFEFGTTDGRPMALAGRRCFPEAALASRDYLIYGPLLTTRQQAISTFHMGRNLAFAGREQEAAVAVSAARRSDQTPTGLDWNTYVQGVYAFLVKDPNGLAGALSKLEASAGEGDRNNAANLRQLQTCFSRPYLNAMSDSDCGPRPSVH